MCLDKNRATQPAHARRWMKWCAPTLNILIVSAAPSAAQPSATFELPAFALSHQEHHKTTSQPHAPTPQSAPASAQASAGSAEESADESADEEGLLGPFTIEITYYLYSDYVFRGTNFSEYPGEGRESPNHQVTTQLNLDIAGLLGAEPGRFGELGFGTFWAWYGAQMQLDPNQGGQNLSEIDYTISWAYEVESLHTTITPMYVFYVYPQHTDVNTAEWCLRADHNDAWAWQWLWPDNEDGILNPYVMYAHTVDYAAGAKWLELGFSHPFALTDELTLTPSATVAWQGEYYARQAKRGPAFDSYALTQVGLVLDYDLTTLLNLPEKLGAVTISGFLYYSDGNQSLEAGGFLRDEVYGGVSIGWSF